MILMNSFNIFWKMTKIVRLIENDEDDGESFLLT